MFIPVGLAVHLAHNLAHLLLEGGGIVPVVQRTAAIFTPFNTIFAANNGTALYLGGQVTLAREDHDLFATGGDENSAIVYKGKDYSEADLNDGTWRRSSGLGRGTFAASPAFQGAGDYHLRAGSPGVDDGTASGASATDLDGVSRPKGAGFDIGPYER